MAKVEIGKHYESSIKEYVRLYKSGLFSIEEKTDIFMNHSSFPISCYSCLKRVNETHVKIEKEKGEKARFHKDCIEFLSIVSSI